MLQITVINLQIQFYLLTVKLANKKPEIFYCSHFEYFDRKNKI